MRPKSKVHRPYSISRTCLAKEFGLVSWEFICLYILVEQHVLWPLDGVSETAAAIANMHAIPNKGHSRDIDPEIYSKLPIL